MGCNKDKVAEELIDWHFQMEPEIEEVYRIISPNEESDEEPIKLLEVSQATPETGRVDAFVFGPTAEMPCSTIVATVSGSEMALIRNGEIKLPEGWNLASARRHSRPERRHARR